MNRIQAIARLVALDQVPRELGALWDTLIRESSLCVAAPKCRWKGQ